MDSEWGGELSCHFPLSVELQHIQRWDKVLFALYLMGKVKPLSETFPLSTFLPVLFIIFKYDYTHAKKIKSVFKAPLIIYHLQSSNCYPISVDNILKYYKNMYYEENCYTSCQQIVVDNIN